MLAWRSTSIASSLGDGGATGRRGAAIPEQRGQAAPRRGGNPGGAILRAAGALIAALKSPAISGRKPATLDEG